MLHFGCFCCCCPSRQSLLLLVAGEGSQPLQLLLICRDGGLCFPSAASSESPLPRPPQSDPPSALSPGPLLPLTGLHWQFSLWRPLFGREFPFRVWNVAVPDPDLSAPQRALQMPPVPPPALPALTAPTLPGTVLPSLCSLQTRTEDPLAPGTGTAAGGRFSAPSSPGDAGCTSSPELP